MHLSIETPTPPPTPGKYGALMGVAKGFGTFLCPRGWGICCFFLHQFCPWGGGLVRFLTFVDERGLRRVSCIQVLSQPQRRFQRGVYTTEQKWHGSDKNCDDSNSFCKEKFYPFCNWSIGACGPDTERIKLHCFFAKTIGTVPVSVGSVPFLLCRVNAPQDGRH